MEIRVKNLSFEGDLVVPEAAVGLVVFAHGSGSSRHSPRNKQVAATLNEAGHGTLLFDLLTPEEDTISENRFDIPLLAQRLCDVVHFVQKAPETKKMKIGLFGSSTGAAAALVAAAHLGSLVSAVVSRGGRPDLAGKSLPQVAAPTLLIVGGSDAVVLELNELAYRELGCEKKLEIIEGASHLFEETGALEQVASLSAKWFSIYF